MFLREEQDFLWDKSGPAYPSPETQLPLTRSLNPYILSSELLAVVMVTGRSQFVCDWPDGEADAENWYYSCWLPNITVDSNFVKKALVLRHRKHQFEKRHIVLHWWLYWTLVEPATTRSCNRNTKRSKRSNAVCQYRSLLMHLEQTLPCGWSRKRW